MDCRKKITINPKEKAIIKLEKFFNLKLKFKKQIIAKSINEAININLIGILKPNSPHKHINESKIIQLYEKPIKELFLIFENN